ncbi:AI-2E family transporter [Rhodobacteraceae bacterium RKSG542]|uniref:AI-2E family transporter n=1 Tax=Pseudovibrio flavus TaxID=2529854 RepID=UPI0012BD4B42|nr:AI-2E family transporter [Pseudovibrio flavus]MTI19089.1 AI-2E family transporter [Pseudovibrio flavus]
MRQPLVQFTLALLMLCIIGWLFYVGRSLLVPFIIALVLWYIINSVSAALLHTPYIGKYLPKSITIVMALFLIFYALTWVFNIVTVNLQQLAQDAPIYQERLDQVLLTVSEQLKLNDTLTLGDIIPNFSISHAISTGAGLLTTVAGSSSLIIVYVLFLIFEANIIDKKLAALFADSNNAKLAFAIRDEVSRRMLRYVGIKTGVSIATGLCTYALLVTVGLPYAALFAFITFMLNYIPTIGSMIAVIFPSLFSLVYFDTLAPFFIVTFGLVAIQFTIGSIIDPRLMGTSLNISPLVIMLSLSFWGSLWGVIGMVLCVPLMVLVIMICAQFPKSRPIAILLSGNGDVGEPIVHKD